MEINWCQDLWTPKDLCPPTPDTQTQHGFSGMSVPWVLGWQRPWPRGLTGRDQLWTHLRKAPVHMSLWPVCFWVKLEVLRGQADPMHRLRGQNQESEWKKSRNCHHRESLCVNCLSGSKILSTGSALKDYNTWVLTRVSDLSDFTQTPSQMGQLCPTTHGS